jgi:hypothetical protein
VTTRAIDEGTTVKSAGSCAVPEKAYQARTAKPDSVSRWLTYRTLR